MLFQGNCTPTIVLVNAANKSLEIISSIVQLFIIEYTKGVYGIKGHATIDTLRAF